MASVGANIAEGAGQESPAQFARFLVIAIASANEVANHLQLANDLQLIPRPCADRFLSEIGQVRAMLITLHKRVRERTSAVSNTTPTPHS